MTYAQAKGLLAINPQVPPYRADIPKALTAGDVEYRTVARICVASNGSVNSVSITKSAGPAVDKAVATAMRRWRYRPLMVGGTSTPFCYSQPYVIRSN